MFFFHIGGSGGSVWIETGILDVGNNGWISANGGGSIHSTDGAGNIKLSYHYGAGGGGGRIALYATTYSIATSANVEAAGGENIRLCTKTDGCTPSTTQEEDYAGDLGTVYRNDTSGFGSTDVVDVTNFAPQQGSMKGLYFGSSTGISIKALDYYPNTEFEISGNFMVKEDFTMWPSTLNKHIRSFAKLDIKGNLILKSKSVLRVGFKRYSSTSRLDVGGDVIVNSNAELHVECVANIAGSFHVATSATFETTSDLTVGKELKVDGTLNGNIGDKALDITSSTENDRKISCLNLVVSSSGKMTLSGIDIEASKSIKIAGSVHGLAYTIVTEDLVVEEAGLITADGVSNARGQTRLYNKYDTFLEDVKTTYALTSPMFKEIRSLIDAVKAREKPGVSVSVKETSVKLHAIQLLDSKYPAAFDALFLTGGPEDSSVTAPCVEPKVTEGVQILIEAGVHGGFPGKSGENPDSTCFGKTYGNPLAPIDIGTKGYDSIKNHCLGGLQKV